MDGTDGRNGLAGELADARPVQAGTVGQVLECLDTIVDHSRAEESPAGYFAALYRQVTSDVERGITHGLFEDPARMERLDIVFANRYLRAYTAHREGRFPGESWAAAFRAGGDWWPTVLQHLLLGINAHINLDLGIAAAEVARDSLDDLEVDFRRINAILGARVDGVQEALARIWPVLRIVDLGAGGADEAVVHFSIRRAREHAWSVARSLVGVAVEERARAVASLDGRVADLGRRIRRPGGWLGAKLRFVRLGELGSVERKIDVLAR